MTANRRQFAITASLAAIILAAAFTRFYRLGEPDQCYFDEVYFPTTGAEMLRTFGQRLPEDTVGTNADAWSFFGHENTHPPLSKELMAAGMAIFGHQGRNGVDNQCWKDEPDSARRTDPNWIYEPFGWRFFGALAGVGAVFFIYLIARKLFQSEVAGLSAAFLLTFEGLAFVQSRIATPDTYVLFFLLGAVYFLLSDRLSIRALFMSGLFLGAAVASKWTAALMIVPILLYLAWTLARRLRETERNERLWLVEVVMLIGLFVVAAGLILTAFGLLVTGNVYFDLLIIPATGALTVLGGLIPVALSGELRNTQRGRFYLRIGLAVPLCLVLAPISIYALTYIPMLMNGHDVNAALRLNKDAYDFHSSLEATHDYQSAWWEWPILARPLFLFVGGYAKIYSMGNPAIFWLGMPAVGFVLYQGLRNVRAKFDEATGALSLSGNLTRADASLLFVGLSYLGFWLPWAINPRALFIYHYLPAVAFLILALSYCVQWLWHAPNRAPEGRLAVTALLAAIAAIAASLFLFRVETTLDFLHGLDTSYQQFLFMLVALFVGTVAVVAAYASREERWGRVAVVGFLATVAITFVYFYPHWAAVDVSQSFDRSYYWFDRGIVDGIFDWS